LHFDDLQSERNFNSLSTFGMTKMANLLFTYELARRMENTGVSVNAVHPGLVRSDLMKEAALPIRLLSWVLASPPSRAAENIARLASAPEFADTNGKFIHNGNEIQPAAYALDPANQLKLWEISERLTRASEASEMGAEYDPTGSVAMFDDRDLPEGLVRPEDNQTKSG
jgi:NAD(P)-dependent dehydrogenase (short-subunit alcohol dehydrogenase family)